MLNYPTIDPVAIAFGPLKVHWYGLMYLFSFVGIWWLATQRAKQGRSPVAAEALENLIVNCAIGVIVGGRCGYVLFYQFDRFLDDPLWLLRVWEGGMSFHGGMLGVVVALCWYARKHQLPWYALTDFIVPLVPIGLGLGRLGNFIGQELWGRPTDSPLGMVFPNDPLALARHPSQLYQFFLEGVVLFAVLNLYVRKPRPPMAASGLFLMLYGCFRFAVEFFREPDAHLGFDAFGWLTRGQILSIPMFLIGLALWLMAHRRAAHNRVNE